MKKVTNQFNELFELFNDCKKQLPKIADELQATTHRTTFSFEQEDDEEPKVRVNVNLSFGKSANYSCGSYVSLTHQWDKVEKTLRQYHKEWLEKEAKDLNKKKIEEEKDRVYQEYLNSKKELA